MTKNHFTLHYFALAILKKELIRTIFERFEEFFNTNRPLPFLIKNLNPAIFLKVCRSFECGQDARNNDRRGGGWHKERRVEAPTRLKIPDFYG